MTHFVLRCRKCDRRYAADMTTLACEHCGTPLDVAYDESAPRYLRGRHDMPLPLADPDSALTLGEGDTPLVPLPAMAAEIGLDSLLGKLEFVNPTGSYKDRGAAVMVAVAREQGVTEVVEDSSGNAGAAVSAYAARSGIKAHIFAPATAPEAKVAQIKIYGAEVHSIEGSRDDTADAAVAYSKDNDIVYASHAWSPYFPEGTKSFAYEVVDQLDGLAPDHVVFPVGNGGLLLGAYAGFRELIEGGHIGSMPRLHAVQSRSVMPLVKGFAGLEWDSSTATTTVAGGISVVAPVRGAQVIDTLRATGGSAIAVLDEDILGMQRLLASSEGVFAEPTSAAAFAGLKLLVQDGVVERDGLTVVAVTGFGLKDKLPELKAGSGV
jgi:threonine synthase